LFLHRVHRVFRAASRWELRGRLDGSL
jgi:hypothetical protein